MSLGLLGSPSVVSFETCMGSRFSLCMMVVLSLPLVHDASAADLPGVVSQSELTLLVLQARSFQPAPLGLPRRRLSRGTR